jgi:NADPH:quinone reductase-like Zn-dependent oxidoreductase
MRDVANVEPESRVLVNDASGGIGSFAVQIAKNMGVEVTAVCSGVNVAMVKDLGADHVIDYGQEDFTKGEVEFDVILDIAGVHSVEDRRRVLTEHGPLIPKSGRGGPWFGSLGWMIGAWLKSPFISKNLKPFLSVAKTEDLKQLPLAETAEAVVYVGEGHARGKTVITI